MLTSLFPQDALDFAGLAAKCADPVLLTGETGCGKTHLARLIHDRGPRARRPFVRVNCAAIPESLFEREMFGHVRGAFTDARESADGFLQSADGGTLFLDEMGELPLHAQPKLLAALEECTFRKLGSTRELRVDVRVVSATNCDLPEMIEQKRFRRDLFYRCSVLHYHIAPLRERANDLPALVRTLLERSAPAGSSSPPFAEDALRLLRAHPWPGNLRELSNVLRAALVFAEGGAVQADHLRRLLKTAPAGERRTSAPIQRYAAPDDPAREIEMIREALSREGGNRTRAARRLGMSRSALWIKLQRYGTALG